MKGNFLKGLKGLGLASIALVLAACTDDLTTSSEQTNTTSHRDFPRETVTLIVPFSAGGGTDILARHMAKNLSEQWSTQVIVKNMAGASGRVAENYVKNRPADGYTLYFNNSSFTTVPPILTPELPKVEGFTALGSIAKSSSLLIVPADSRFDTLESLLNESDKLYIGSCGLGTPQHWAVMRLKRDAETTHVPYGGCADALLEVVREELSAAVVTQASAKAMLENGSVRALAITSARQEAATDALATSELWLKNGPNLDQWYAVFVHEETADEIKRQIAATLMEVFDTPQFAEELAPFSLTPYLQDGETFDTLLKEEQAAFIEFATQQ